MPAYQYLHCEPLTDCIGAEISGLDLSNTLAEDALAEVRQVFLDYHVVTFRNQTLTPEAQKTFGAYFGEFEIHPFRPPIPGYPELLSITKEADEQHNVGGGWHTDMTFLPTPPKGSMLYALELPPAGLGDTMFSSCIAAYEALSPTLQSLLMQLVGLHSAERVHGESATKEQSAFRQAAAKKPEATQVIKHPVVRIHPESGRKGLFVNPSFTFCFEGMTQAESKPLLDFLFEHMSKPEFVLRYQWQVGDLVFWDNRCTQHYALNDYHGHRREMRRLMIVGDRPQ
ncbi:MAG: TauD/TfdA family dioxygenase [Pseudomonadota bacterium]